MKKIMFLFLVLVGQVTGHAQVVEVNNDSSIADVYQYGYMLKARIIQNLGHVVESNESIVSISKHCKLSLREESGLKRMIPFGREIVFNLRYLLPSTKQEPVLNAFDNHIKTLIFRTDDQITVNDLAKRCNLEMEIIQDLSVKKI
jgi:hypothetical protein